MNREIKFRAWDKNFEEMIPWDQLLRLGATLSALSAPNYEVMQHTGLMDRNEKDIYEGDIIRCPKGRTHMVKWVETDWGPGFVADRRMPWMWVVYEVIGNIYENPELMEGAIEE